MYSMRAPSADKGRQRSISLVSKAIAVTKVLRREYGSPRHNNKTDPLDELVFIVLSQMTTFRSYERVFERLKVAAPRWVDVLQMPTSQLKALIKDAGLSNQKAPRIKAMLKAITLDFGSPSLKRLGGMSTKAAEEYLISLPGVQRKTAKCVLMYSLKRKVLPVDTHTLRVSRRLGLTSEVAIGTRVHMSLEALFPSHLRYSYHVNALAHGRTV